MDSVRCLMAFEEMVTAMVRDGIEDWPCLLVPRPEGRMLVSEKELKEKLHNTWWEVIWTAGVPRCRYIADSLRDALRLRPHIDISDSFTSAMHWISLIQDVEDEWDQAELCCMD